MFFIDIASGAVQLAGSTSHPDTRRMTQIARNLTDPQDGFVLALQVLEMMARPERFDLPGRFVAQ